MKRYWLLNLLLALLLAAQAHACMSHAILPGLWRAPPLYAGKDEVVLKVEFIATAHRERAAHEVVSSCDGSTYIFRVMEVQKGTLDATEVGIELPIIGDLFDTPLIGETRYIVGRPVGTMKLSRRYADNALELKKTGLRPGSDAFLDKYKSKLAGGPSSVAQIQLRSPIEHRLLFSPEEGPWLFAWMCMTIFVFRFVVFVVRVEFRQRSRSR